MENHTLAVVVLGHPDNFKKTGRAAIVAVGSLADKPSPAKIHLCPLLSGSGQNLRRSECPLCAKSRQLAYGS